MFKFLRSIFRAIRWNRQKHIPPDVFISLLENRFKRCLDESSRQWFQTHDIAVDLLHQMLCGRIKAGTAELDYDVMFVLIDGMFFYTTKLEPEVLHGKDAFENIWDAFSKEFPDAGAVIAYAIATWTDKPSA